MEIFIALFISLLILLFLYKLFDNTPLNFLGPKSHPFGLFVFIQFIVVSVPGVILISFLQYGSERYYGISEYNRFTIGIWYLYTFVMLFFCLYLLIRYGGLNWYKKSVGVTLGYEKYSKYFYMLIFISFMFLLLKLALSKPAPIYYLILGDIDKAYQTRIDMQLNPSEYYIPYFSRFITMFIIYQFYFCFYFYMFASKKKAIMRVLIVFSFIMAALEALYDTQKAPLVFVLLGALFIYQLRNRNIFKLLVPGALLVATVVILQSLVTGADFSESMNKAVDRFILGQNQGFYHILNSIIPNEKYWFNGFFFIEQFGIEPARADMDVLPYTIYAGTDIVNVNSYFMGEAWSMFGYYGILFSPFVVALMIFIYLKIIDLYIGVEPAFGVPFMIYFVPEIRVQQSFTYFLYSKTFVLSFVLFIAIVYTVKLAVASLDILGSKKNISINDNVPKK